MEIRTYRIQPRETIQPERPSMAVAWAMGAVLYVTCAAFVWCLYALFGG
jgi:hypothetical protein